MLRAHINRLDGILFTHEHKDHTAGLDDVRAFNFRQQQDMPLYAEPRVLDAAAGASLPTFLPSTSTPACRR